MTAFNVFLLLQLILSRTFPRLGSKNLPNIPTIVIQHHSSELFSFLSENLPVELNGGGRVIVPQFPNIPE